MLMKRSKLLRAKCTGTAFSQQKDAKGPILKYTEV